VARVVQQRGAVAELHALDPFDVGGTGDVEPQVWWCDPIDAAVVLGSRQRPEMLDLVACDRAGLTVVRRRSGGGAVVIRPETVCWIDLVIPHGVAPDDVRGSMVWAGQRWMDALAPDLAAGADDSAVTLHRGGMICTPWSELVCFAGTGPGELMAGDRKLVGLSQRRTRRGLRIQGLVHVAVAGDLAARLWTIPHPDVALPEAAVLDTLAVDGAVAALAARLADRLVAG
jgi:lipoate-protein ligase A